MEESTPGRLADVLAMSVRAGAATMIVVLPAFWSMLQLGAWWRPPIDAIVFAVMLGLALPRALARTDCAQVPLAVAPFFLACMAATGSSMLLDHDDGWRTIGAMLFSAGVAIPIWFRRLGRAGRAIGTLAGLPFLAVLVRPSPGEQTWSFLGWMLLGAGIALTWALLVRSLTPPDPTRPENLPPRRAAGFRASTRMAIQLGCATAAAFGAAQLLDPDHLVWPVLTALIVHSGNHGRGDVLVTGAQRIVGALTGTAVATLLADVGLLSMGNSSTLVLLFAILALAAAARPFGYAYWAAGITAALAFLYGYFGQFGLDLLGHRLLGIAVGGTLAIAAAWFLLPVRTLDVARLRLARLLAEAAATTGAAARGEPATEPARGLYVAERQLAALDTTARTARHLRLGSGRSLDALLTDAHHLTAEVLGSINNPARYHAASLGRLARDLATTARALSDKRHPLIATNRSARDTILTGLLGRIQCVRAVGK